MTERDLASLYDIVRAAELIARFAQECGEEEFRTEGTLAQSALLHQLLILGEATTRISDDLRHDYPDVDWRDAVQLRNRTIHGYDSLDFDVLWDTIIESVPRYREQVQAIIDAAIEPSK